MQILSEFRWVTIHNMRFEANYSGDYLWANALSQFWDMISRWEVRIDEVNERCLGFAIRAIQARIDFIPVASCLLCCCFAWLPLLVAVHDMTWYVMDLEWCVPSRPSSDNSRYEEAVKSKKPGEIIASFRCALRFHYRLAATVMLYESSPAVTRLTVYRGLQVGCHS